MQKNQTGAAILIMVIILLTAAVLVVLYASMSSVLQQKTSSNQLQSSQASEAAQGGLEFGLSYLISNSSTVTGSPTNGFINYGSSNSSLTNVSLTNGSKFSVVYTNPTQSNYNLLKISSTGVSADGTSTHVISELAAQQPSTFNYTVSSLGNVTFVGGSTLTNTVTNLNISTGGTVTINNGASTYTSTGQTSSQGNIGSDIQQNVATYSGMTENQFFQAIFGQSESTVLSTVQAAGNYYSNAGPDYSQNLSGKQGNTYWISQTNGSTVTLGQGVTIGSASSPVTLIVEGDLTIANGVTIYGFVYASGPTNGLSLAGGAKMYGGFATAGTTNISNGFQLTYTKFPTLSGGSGGTFAKVPGSWKDF